MDVAFHSAYSRSEAEVTRIILTAKETWSPVLRENICQS